MAWRAMLLCACLTRAVLLAWMRTAGCCPTYASEGGAPTSCCRTCARAASSYVEMRERSGLDSLLLCAFPDDDEVLVNRNDDDSLRRLASRVSDLLPPASKLLLLSVCRSVNGVTSGCVFVACLLDRIDQKSPPRPLIIRFPSPIRLAAAIGDREASVK